MGLTRPRLCITKSAGSGPGWPPEQTVWGCTHTQGALESHFENEARFFDRLEILQQL